jgi:hypothetical protein
MRLNDTLRYLSGLLAGTVTIWFFFWPYRRKFELDVKLDRTEQALRWSVFLIGFSIQLLRNPEYKWLRFVAMIVAIAFVAWPNYAHHVAMLARRFGVMRPPESKGSDPSRRVR